MTTAAEVLAEHPVILLDFDGPVCAIFSGITADTITAELVELLATQGIHVPAANAGGPHDVLSFAGEHAPHFVPEVEAYLARREVDAAKVAEATPGAVELLRAWRDSSARVALVSNNTADAVRTYLERIDLADAFPIIGRDPSDSALMKPNPHLLTVALRELHASPAEAILIGDSTTDIEAAHNAGTASIAYANRPAKRARFEPLHPTAIINAMSELVPELPVR
jgi:HAD superfamily hydrolase (TIGR01549 family)